MKKIHTDVATVGNAAARAVSWAPGNEETYYCGSRSAWFTAFQGGYNLQQNDTRILDGGTTFFYFAIGITPAREAKSVGMGSQCAIAAKDADGNWLDGRTNYKLTLPADIPHDNFGSFTNHFTQTRSMQQTDYLCAAGCAGKGSLKDGSPNGPVKRDLDSKTTFYFGPKAPEGKASDWTQAVSGRGWFNVLCLYSPLQPWFDPARRPGEIEVVK